MKEKFFLAALLAMNATARAQSSVSLFGSIDVGMTYVSNQNGHAVVKFDDGIFSPNLIVLRGNEGLGSGASVLFELSSQFSPGTGEFIGSGIFGRTAFLGLHNDRFGTLTLGYQYDFMYDVLLLGGDDSARDVAGLYNFRNGPFQKLALPDNPTGAFDWDRVGATQRVPDAVKYVSPSVDGMTFGALYGLRDPDSATGLESTQSFGVSYGSGNFGVGAAYTNQRYTSVAGSPASTITNFGTGAHYATDELTTSVLFTSVRNSASGATAWMIEVGTTRHLTQALILGVDYLYMKGNARVDDNHAHQIDASLQYALSKQTTVYVSGVYQRASSGAHAQIDGVLDPDGASSSPTQVIAHLGVHTAF
ncbi:porin [Burkholderia cepacia]|uniref:porin n=1 Tax=Burkholderia cepacia TaxID=292 RepID=UPI00249DDD3A|nr:porin [Burkholderia cepacia]WGY72096.1 porin [Burkholderia cepacia]